MILVSGSSGFLGTYLTQALTRQGLGFIRFIRAKNETVFTDNYFSSVIYLAARVHVMRETSVNPLAEFRKSNVIETVEVARRAADAGVKRFIYISSIGVNGEANTLPFTENDVANPHNHYTQSKHEAELALKTLAIETGMEVVIIRPPLVYGPAAPGNFGTLLKFSSKGIPLPLGAIRNRRSMIYVGNLVDFIILCACPERSPRAANETFLISDGHDLSTTYLLRSLAKAQGKPAMLLPVPASWLKFVLKCLGKSDISKRLLGDLRIDSGKAHKLLSWKPPYTVAQGLANSVNKK